MKRSIKPAAGHWFSWQPRSYIPARSSTSCYTLCKPFSQPSAQLSIGDWIRSVPRVPARKKPPCGFFVTAERWHMTGLLRISLILQTILTISIVTYTWFATRNYKNMIYKHGGGSWFRHYSTKNSPIRLCLFISYTCAQSNCDTFGIFFFLNTNLYARST